MRDPATGKFASTRWVLPAGQRRGGAREARLSEAWASFIDGRASREDAELILADLGDISGYFNVAGDDATGDQMLRREGRRDVMARILFLLDMPFSYMTEMRRASLDEFNVTNYEGD